MARQVKENPPEWEYVLSYHEVMSLRAAYRCGYRSPEALHAVSIYTHYRRQLQLKEKGQAYAFKYTTPYNPRHKDKLVRIPEGYILMPKEPTEKMIDAGHNFCKTNIVTPTGFYKSMIEAAQELSDV